MAKQVSASMAWPSILCTFCRSAQARISSNTPTRLFEQPPKLFSWWDYRALGFRRNAGLRIDLILVSDELKPMVGRCWIDKGPRKLEKPSDHTPVVVEWGAAAT